MCARGKLQVSLTGPVTLYTLDDASFFSCVLLYYWAVSYLGKTFLLLGHLQSVFASILVDPVGFS